MNSRIYVSQKKNEKKEIEGKMIKRTALNCVTLSILCLENARKRESAHVASQNYFLDAD